MSMSRWSSTSNRRRSRTTWVGRVDYGAVFEVARTVVESTSFRLIEALAEALAQEVLRAFPPITEVGIRVRKPNAPIDGTLGWAGVEIWRQRLAR